MCHLILLIPVLGLPIFWLAPPEVAIPSYAVILLLSVLLYWLIAKSMRKPVRDGFRSLVGTKAEVVSRLAPEHSARYLVRSQGELWSAYSTAPLQPGETVNIVAVRGIGVVVEPVDNSHDEMGNVETIAGARNNEQPCH